MDYLWTPWRYSYVASGVKDDRCIFCAAAEGQDDAQSLVVLRARRNFVILNRYPYTSGHVMIVPYAHEPKLAGMPQETSSEMMLLAQRLERVLDTLYHPDGCNLGMNIGRAAGAGIAGHLHLHVLPRWIGDTNFMTTVGETRVQPEELTTTYQRMRAALSA
ncbi:MAG TPA: HIT domain-containing protein [Candidatus Acidoferrales bacterium]|jgi:ATP adenylyltransferase|nr:HIT domain-containing protein [Candidatus Acidoferrales bacterium]